MTQAEESPPTFLSCFHAGNKVVAFVLAIVLVGIVQRHPHTFKLVPFIPNIPSSDWVLDALFLGPQPTTTAPAWTGRGKASRVRKLSEEPLTFRRGHAPIFISSWWPLFSSPSRVSDSLEGVVTKADVELQRASLTGYNTANHP